MNSCVTEFFPTKLVVITIVYDYPGFRLVSYAKLDAVGVESTELSPDFSVHEYTDDFELDGLKFVGF